MRKGLAAWGLGATGVAVPLLRARPFLREAVTILCYHRVLPVADLATFPFDTDVISATPEDFDWQMRFLRRHMSPIGIAEFLDALSGGQALPVRSVVVTFDDGYDDCYNHALPILEKYRIPATAFVTTGYIDSQDTYWFDRLAYSVLHTRAKRLELPELNWVLDVPVAQQERRDLYHRIVGRLKTVTNQQRLASLQKVWEQAGVTLTREIARYSQPMSAAQLAHAAQRGLAIHSHTVTHPILSQIDASELDFELRESRATIAAITGGAPDALAYPNGTWSDFGVREIEAARRHGYRAGITYEVGVQRRADIDIFRLLRMPVNRTHTRGWFRTMLAWPELASGPTASPSTQAPN
jgi:peptidoglycan/xylan/chitin deacetylase (PgdA/CDA1 family)